MNAAVSSARRDADAARERLIGTAQTLAAALAPKRLAAQAWDNAKDKGADLAENAVDTVKRRPVAFGSALAALTLFLAREPLMDAARGLKERWSDEDENGEPTKATPPSPPRASSKSKASKPRSPRPASKRTAAPVKGS